MNAARPAQRGASRRVVLVWLIAAAAVVAGIIALAEGLRHPAPAEERVGVDDEPLSGDPRIEAECPEPQPREDLPRDEATVIGPPDIADAVEITSNELYDCPESWDRRTVRYRGEAVGAVLGRRNGAWVQINDDIYAGVPGPLPAHRDYGGGNGGIGVFFPGQAADVITTVGGYKTSGDVVEIIGTFHRVDPRSREVTVIRATSVELIEEGVAITPQRLPDRQLAAAVLVVLALAAVGWDRGTAWRRSRARRGS